MQVTKAKKVVIITEKLIAGGVKEIIEACGGTGYTILSAGGKGSRHDHPSDRAVVVDAFEHVKIEVITTSTEHAYEIVNKVAEQYFENYSGITYLEDVEILRPQKFS